MCLIALSDLVENKIPNNLLLVWLGVHSLHLHAVDGSFVSAICGGLLLFLGGFALYVIKAMSPGDVKLLGVIGFVIGVQHVPEAVFFILMSAGLIAGYYLLYNFSCLGISNPLMAITEPRLLLGSNYIGGNNNTFRYRNRLTMPFAPAVAIGLAMFFYFL